jgi:hypothetical protein
MTSDHFPNDWQVSIFSMYLIIAKLSLVVDVVRLKVGILHGK